MSLILDALNRSESDRRNPEEVPGLQSRHGPESATPAWRRFLWPALSLLFALLALALWLGRGGDDAPAAAAAAPPQTSAKAVAEQAPRSLPARRLAETPPRPVPVPAPQAAPVPEAAEPALDPDVAALYQRKPAKKAAAPAAPVAAAPKPARAEPVEPSLDVNAMTKAAQAALEERAVVEETAVQHAAPFITDLRQSVKDQIPSIFYNEHSWSSNPAERSVVLNRQRFTEGQQIKPGLRLLEILPDSIVLDFNGTEFRLQSLNSWVNL